MFSKPSVLQHYATTPPKKSREISPEKIIDVSEKINKLSHYDVTPPSNNVGGEDEHRTCSDGNCTDNANEAMRKIFEAKINLKIDSVLKKKSRKQKTWRPKSSLETLRVRYLKEDYIPILLGCKRHQDFDNAKRPTCNCKCSFRCQEKFTVNEMRQEMQKWWGNGVNESARTSLLCEDLRKGLTLVEDGTYVQKYIINDKEVCRNFYLRARGQHNQKVFMFEKQILQGRSSALGEALKNHRNNDKKTGRSEKQMELVRWITLFAKHVGDKMPDECDVTVLPYHHAKAIWEEYSDDLSSQNGIFGEPLKLKRFYTIFNKVCVKNKFRLLRSTGTHVICTVCDAYHSRLRKVKSLEEREQLKKMRRNHLDKQTLQREKYYKHKGKAVANPNKYMSIIFDGMDQKKTHLPVWSRYTKDESPLEQRLIGVKVHGIRNYVFLVDASVPGGSNLMIEILRRVLLDLEAKGELPTKDPVLYLQADNCGENKNKVLFGFLTHLVRLGVFQKIKVGFLMVGHTHEDIDQFFSVLAGHLLAPHVICPDIETFVDEIKKAFHDEKMKPEIIFLQARNMFDFKTLYTAAVDKSISYHQEPHQFRIKQHFSEDKQKCTVLVHYKNWCHSSYWLPMAKKSMPSYTATTNLNKDQSEQDAKRRKMDRGYVPVAQRSLKPQLAITSSTATANDEFEVEVSPNLNAPPTANNCDDNFYQTGLSGISWLLQTPCLNNIPFISFDLSTIQQTHAWFAAVVSDIQKRFKLKYSELFSSDVQLNWSTWLQQNQSL